jgi:hypothetical protein
MSEHGSGKPSDKSGDKSDKGKAPDPAQSTGGPQDAPGPILKEHESGTTEQTLKARELRDKAVEAEGGPSAEEVQRLRDNPRSR